MRFVKQTWRGVHVGRRCCCRFYGFPRATADIDFWYNPSIQNFHRIIHSLDEFGVDTSTLNEVVFDPKKTFLRVPQFGFSIEFLPHIQGLNSFPESKRSATMTDLDGIPIFVLGYDDLLKNKETLKRDADLCDVEELKKRNNKL